MSFDLIDLELRELLADIIKLSTSRLESTSELSEKAKLKLSADLYKARSRLRTIGFESIATRKQRSKA